MNENDQTLPPVDAAQDRAKKSLADAWAEVPDRLRGKSHILTLAHAVRELALESDARDRALRLSDKYHMQARAEIEDALLEIPARFREGKALKQSIQALVRALGDAESAAITLAINAEPVDGGYQRGRAELAEELSTLVGEYLPSKGAWHYVMGCLDIITNKAEVLR